MRHDAQILSELAIFTMPRDAYNMLQHMDAWTFMRHQLWKKMLTVKDV